MRTIIIALFALIVAVGQISSARAFQCKDITPKSRVTVGNSVPGFVPVGVMLKVPVQKGTDPASVAQKALFKFWVQGHASKIRGDKAWNVQEIYQCAGERVDEKGRRTQDSKMYFSVRAEVIDNRQFDNGYVLGTGIMLPKELVGKTAGTVLDSGESYKGTWGTERGVTILTLQPE